MRGLWVLALAGCDKDDKAPAAGAVCESGEIGLEVGTGVDAYEPLLDGDVLTMVHGPQGGWHIEAGGFVQGAPREITILPQLRTGSGLLVSMDLPPKFQALVGHDDSACEGTFYNVQALIDYQKGPMPTGQENICRLEGQELEMSVTVGDMRSGREATSTVHIVTELDPIDVGPCRQQ